MSCSIFNLIFVCYIAFIPDYNFVLHLGYSVADDDMTVCQLVCNGLPVPPGEFKKENSPGPAKPASIVRSQMILSSSVNSGTLRVIIVAMSVLCMYVALQFTIHFNVH